MVLCYLLDGGPSHSGPLLGPSMSIRGGTPGTNSRQRVSLGGLVRQLCPIWPCAASSNSSLQ
jgi:hypothetical protein